MPCHLVYSMSFGANTLHLKRGKVALVKIKNPG